MKTFLEKVLLFAATCVLLSSCQMYDDSIAANYTITTDEENGVCAVILVRRETSRYTLESVSRKNDGARLVCSSVMKRSDYHKYEEERILVNSPSVMEIIFDGETVWRRKKAEKDVASEK